MGYLSDEYIDGFCKHVYTSNPEYKKRDIVKVNYTNVNGRKFDRTMIQYLREDYMDLAKLCIDWAQCNPEKVDM